MNKVAVLAVGTAALAWGSAARGQCTDGGQGGPSQFFAPDVAHAYISEIEQKLTERGYYLGPIDGQANPALQSAICKLQEDLGQPARGVADQTVVYALRFGPTTLGPFSGGAAVAPAPPPKAADAESPPKAADADLPPKAAGADLPPKAADAVERSLRDLQAGLAAKGYYTGPVDGVPRADLAKAVIAYERDAHQDGAARSGEPPTPDAAPQPAVAIQPSPTQ